MIYYVEDDENIRRLAVYALEKASLPTQGFPDARAFFKACSEEIPECVLLDIMLPDTDGLEILSMLREDPRTATVPVMMLTAKGTEIDKVQGLDAGADDYLAKPFGMMELVSRVNALLRRSRVGKQGTNVLTLGSITVDLDARVVKVADHTCILTMKEFDLLALLLGNRDRALSREQIMRAVWDTDFVGTSRTVDVHVLSLRQKIDALDPKAGDRIKTVRGIGYKASCDE